MRKRSQFVEDAIRENVIVRTEAEHDAYVDGLINSAIESLGPVPPNPAVDRKHLAFVMKESRGTVNPTQVLERLLLQMRQV